MNAITNPNYTAYMAAHLCVKTLDEIPHDAMKPEVTELYAQLNDVKSNLWSTLTDHEQKAIRKYNKEQALSS